MALQEQEEEEQPSESSRLRGWTMGMVTELPARVEL